MNKALTLSELRDLELKYDGRIPTQAIADMIAARPAPTELQLAAFRRADRAALSKRELEVTAALNHAEELADQIEELAAEEAGGITSVCRLAAVNCNLKSLRQRHGTCIENIARDLDHIASERARLGLAPHVLTALTRRAG